MSNVHRLYPFADQDPVMEEVCGLIRSSGLSAQEVSARAKGFVSPVTIQSWLDGKTRRPQNYTLDWVLFALGYSRPIIKGQSAAMQKRKSK